MRGLYHKRSAPAKPARFSFTRYLVEHFIDEAVLLRLVGRHEEVTLDIFLDFRD
jgi:hypothetical protein